MEIAIKTVAGVLIIMVVLVVLIAVVISQGSASNSMVSGVYDFFGQIMSGKGVPGNQPGTGSGSGSTPQTPASGQPTNPPANQNQPSGDKLYSLDDLHTDDGLYGVSGMG
jgi:hypothetical protein